jgi:hypothetical protein
VEVTRQKRYQGKETEISIKGQEADQKAVEIFPDLFILF